MPEEWTGVLLGKMHNAGVTQTDMANELGYSRAYVSMVFRSVRGKNSRQAFEQAFESIIAKRNN